MDRRARGFKNDLDAEMDRAGRIIAVSLATSAQPYGLDDEAQQKGATATARDIRRIYATVSDVYGAIEKNGSKRQANAFYKTLKTDIAMARRLITNFAPEFSSAAIGQFDGGALHRDRRNKRGRVPKSQRPLLIVTNAGALNAYIKQEVERVGFGKSGWASAAGAFADKGATRGLPKWVTKHKAPASVLKDKREPGQITVTMVNQVKYAENLLTDADKRTAVGIGIDRLSKGIFQAERRAASTNPL